MAMFSMAADRSAFAADFAGWRVIRRLQDWL
jgi:hypothetical protein